MQVRFLFYTEEALTNHAPSLASPCQGRWVAVRRLGGVVLFCTDFDYPSVKRVAFASFPLPGNGPLLSAGPMFPPQCGEIYLTRGAEREFAY